MFVFWLIQVSLRGSNGGAYTTFGVWGLHLVVKFAFTSYLRLSKLRFHACLSLRSLVLQLILHIRWLILGFELLVLSLFVGLVADAQILQIVFVYWLNVLWEGGRSSD